VPRHIEAVPDEGDDAEPPSRVRARGVSAVSTSVSALILLVLIALLAMAVILVLRAL
jgi:hypothetical protein